MPMGLIRGIVIGGLLAALMASLASVYNACSTFVHHGHLPKRWNPKPAKRIGEVGRIATGVVVILGMWIPMMDKKVALFIHICKACSHNLAPPIAAVFLWVFYKRLNAKGAMGCYDRRFYHLALQNYIRAAVIHWAQVFCIHSPPWSFLYFCILLFLFSIAVMVVVSLMSPEPSAEQIKGLTYATTVAEDRVRNRAPVGMPPMCCFHWA